MKKATGLVRVSMTIDCPECGNEIDAMKHLEGGDNNMSTIVFDEEWEDIELDIACPFCEREFILDKIERHL